MVGHRLRYPQFLFGPPPKLSLSPTERKLDQVMALHSERRFRYWEA